MLKELIAAKKHPAGVLDCRPVCPVEGECLKMKKIMENINWSF